MKPNIHHLRFLAKFYRAKEITGIQSDAEWLAIVEGNIGKAMEFFIYRGYLNEN